MINELEKLASRYGDRLKVIPVQRLSDLKDIIDQFKEHEELNGFQNWVVNQLYRFQPVNQNIQANSIILAAIPHPFCAKVKFLKKGQTRTFLSLVYSDFKRTKDYISEFLNERGYFIEDAGNLPLKRLGAHSGLAKYGRNNITYIEGMGSNFSYAAYFTDLICEEDSWGEIELANPCKKCSLCIENCPTGAIRKDKFLIDTQRCLSYMNEGPGEFPEWLPVSTHHALYDCLFCQRSCPMNRNQLDKVDNNITFSEEETDLMLEGKPLAAFSEECKSKMNYLGMDDYIEVMPRNLKVLFEQQA